MNTKQRLNEIDQMLVQKSINRAQRNGDTINEFRYRGMLGKHLTIVERTDLNIYLFGSHEGAPVEFLESLP